MMRVFLFGLFLRRTSLMEPWPKLIRLVLLVFGFIRFYQFYLFYVSLGDIWSCFIYFCLSICSCMHVLTTRFSIHFYDSDLSIHVCLSLHAIWHSHHHSLGSSDSPESSCLDPGAKSWRIVSVADQSGAAKVWIIRRPSEALFFQTPCSSLEFSFCNSWVSFCTVHYCISPCILTFAPIGDVIFL